jgi:hypothetical protein
VVDVDSLKRVERRVAIKNLEEPQGNLDVHSFCSFSKVRIKKNLGGVGISLGGNDNLILGSISLIKDVEAERLKAPEPVKNLRTNVILRRMRSIPTPPLLVDSVAT